MIRLVLFDIDGTLVSTGGAGVKAFAQAFRTEFGLADGAEPHLRHGANRRAAVIKDRKTAS